MDHLLSLSQAARMVGVPRKVLQQHIQEGHLSTFEGYIRTSELLKEFPEARPGGSGMVEKVRRIREAAVAKGIGDGRPDPERMATEIQRLRVELAQARDHLQGYRQLAAEMADRLLEVEERCDRRQALMLNTLIGWYLHQVKLHDPE